MRRSLTINVGWRAGTRVGEEKIKIPFYDKSFPLCHSEAGNLLNNTNNHNFCVSRGAKKRKRHQTSPPVPTNCPLMDCLALAWHCQAYCAALQIITIFNSILIVHCC